MNLIGAGRAAQSGRGYISQPITNAAAMKPPNIIAPRRACCRGIVAQQDGEDQRDEEGEQRQQEEVIGHLRPIAMSNASSITRKFSRPATIMNVLPYS